jgi:hypothetical protein
MDARELAGPSTVIGNTDGELVVAVGSARRRLRSNEHVLKKHHF